MPAWARRPRCAAPTLRVSEAPLPDAPKARLPEGPPGTAPRAAEPMCGRHQRVGCETPAPGTGPVGKQRLTKRTATACNSAYSMRRISPARGPFCESSGANSTRCPSRSSSNTVPRTELRWKKCSSPDSSRMNPNPLSMRSRAIVPVGIPVSSDSKSLGTSQKLPHPQIPVVSDNEARGAWPAPGDAGTEFCGESKHEFSGKSRCDARGRRHECVGREILSKWR